MSIERNAFEFVLAAFEQGGTQPTPELARLVQLTFAAVDQRLLMQAAVEAMKTTRGRLTIGDLQKQVDLLRPTSAEEHPPAEEAWALLPKSEDETAFMTEEMRDASLRGDINSYLERNDFIGAERAFKKLYDENVSKSRARGLKATWEVTLGHDRSMRIGGLEKAVSKGVINSDRAIDFDPENEAIYLSAEKQFISKLPEEKRKALTGRVEYLQKSILQLVEAKQEPTDPEDKPSEARMNDPYVIQRAASLGLSPYEYLVRPCPPEVAKKVHAQLAKQYGVNLEPMTARKGF